MRPRAPRLGPWLLLVAAVVLAGPLTRAQPRSAADFTIEQVKSYPYPAGLTAAATGARIAWTFNERGQRNIWVAEAPAWTARRLTDYTDRLRELFRDLAVKYHVNIVAGSHPTRSADGRLLNISMVCLRDCTVHEQAKLHPTPEERYWWRIEDGDSLDIIQTDCGPIGVLICYDSEFPELARHLADQGALMLFVPFCTSERQGYLRVRYCCQARAVENQLYVVLSGNVGNLPRVHNMDIQYAQSCILTPCDFPFARDGVAADTTPNCETVAFADLNLSVLRKARQSGTVRNLQDRRHDLYSVVWGRR